MRLGDVNIQVVPIRGGVASVAMPGLPTKFWTGDRETLVVGGIGLTWAPVRRALFFVCLCRPCPRSHKTQAILCLLINVITQVSESRSFGNSVHRYSRKLKIEGLNHTLTVCVAESRGYAFLDVMASTNQTSEGGGLLQWALETPESLRAALIAGDEV